MKYSPLMSYKILYNSKYEVNAVLPKKRKNPHQKNAPPVSRDGNLYKMEKNKRDRCKM